MYKFTHVHCTAVRQIAGFDVLDSMWTTRLACAVAFKSYGSLPVVVHTPPRRPHSFSSSLIKVPNIQADFQNIGQQRVQNANFVRSLNSDLHMTIRANYADQRPSPWGLSNTKQIDQNKTQPNLPYYVVFPSEIKNKTWGNISK